MAADEDADDGDGDFCQPDVALVDLLLQVGRVLADDRATEDVAARLKTPAATCH